MTNTQIFTVYDSKVEAYLPPFTSSSKGDAIRSFEDTINSEGTLLNKHPEDFTLFWLGDFDADNAKINTTSSPVSLGTALELKKD